MKIKKVVCTQINRSNAIRISVGIGIIRHNDGGRRATLSKAYAVSSLSFFSVAARGGWKYGVNGKRAPHAYTLIK
jgi:hypothetical protein